MLQILECSDIYNIDGNGINHVQQPWRINPIERVKQRVSLASADQGTLITVATAVNVTTNIILPIFVFSKTITVNISLVIVHIGANNKSGCMHSDDFFKFIEHFVRHTWRTVEWRALKILDNHESCLYLKGIDFVKCSGVIILSFQPYCSRIVSLLSVDDPLEYMQAVTRGCLTLLENNVYLNIPQIVREALPLVVTPNSIQSELRVSGVWQLPEISLLKMNSSLCCYRSSSPWDYW